MKHYILIGIVLLLLVGCGPAAEPGVEEESFDEMDLPPEPVGPAAMNLPDLPSEEVNA